MNKIFKEHSKLYTENQTLRCEEKRIFYLETKEGCFQKIKIDGGVAKNTPNLKCDYLVIKDGIEDIEIFIELKGSDIKKAMEQLVNSYDEYATHMPNVKHYPVIVSSRYPQEDSSMQKYKEKLRQKFNQTLLNKNNILKTVYNQNNNAIEKIN